MYKRFGWRLFGLAGVLLGIGKKIQKFIDDPLRISEYKFKHLWFHIVWSCILYKNKKNQYGMQV